MALVPCDPVLPFVRFNPLCRYLSRAVVKTEISELPGERVQIQIWGLSLGLLPI